MILAVIKAPRRSKVISLFVTDGAPVSEGQAILTLDSSEDQEELARLAAHETNLQSQLAIVTDADRTNRRISYLQAELDAYTKQEKELHALYNTERFKDNLGLSDIPHVLSAQQSWDRGSYDLIVAQIKRNQYPVDIDHTRRYLLLMIDLLSKEKERANRRIDQMSIKAPVDGNLNLFTALNSPVSRGLVIGEVG